MRTRPRRGWGLGKVVSLPMEDGSGEGAHPLPRKFLLLLTQNGELLWILGRVFTVKYGIICVILRLAVFTQ